MFGLQSLVCTDTDLSPCHKYHCMTWWGHSRRVHSVLIGEASSSLLNTRRRSGHGNVSDRDTDRLQDHRHLTVTHLENRNIWSSPEGWRRSDRSSLSCSVRSGDLQHSLYTDMSLCCLHTGPHSASHQHCRYNVCRHQDGPFGCGGLAGTLGHTGHTLVLWCGAYSSHTHLQLSVHWPRTLSGRNDSAGRGYYTHSVCRCECFPPLQVSRADHCRDQHNAHS